MRQTAFRVFVGLIAVCAGVFAADTPAPDNVAPDKVFPILTPEEELKTFQLPPGYHMELVLSDPVLKEPVVCAFDGDGRMYVAEMRSYMQNIDGTGEMEPINRVSLHESTRGNGVYDKHSVFVDNIMAPREILPLANRVLINVTNTNDIDAYSDTKGTGVADKKEVFYEGGAHGGNIEHQQSGLIWGLDNWMYQAVNSFRLRYTGGKVIKEETPGNGGQWGLAQDDYGKMWFTNAGGEMGPLHYQNPIIYGAFEPSDDRSPDFQEVWPLVGLADVQGGVSRFRPTDKTLNHTTSAAGIDVFRGDRLPKDLEGDVLIPEPVGRLIRRAKVENHQGLTYLRNAYDQSEFIRSTDPYFRPVNVTTGPDGCLYIVDMYRGIIQEASWVNKGSYLRTVVEKYGMQNIMDHGRIWRLVHDGYTPGPQPHMLEETSAQLVAHLDHPNGWWRLEAQKLLVLRGDKSVVPALTAMARSDSNSLARIHAIWTLEGLGALDASLVREKLKDANPQVRIAAMRASESLVLGGDKSLEPALRAMAKDADPNVVLQTLMTVKRLNWPDFRQFAELTITSSQASGVKELGVMLLNQGHAIDEKRFSKTDVAVLHKGEAIYEELCFACHGYDGNGMPMSGAAPGATQAPPLAGAREVVEDHNAIIHVLLNGLSGPVNGKQYLAQMVPMSSNNDEWIASVASFVRNSFGNSGTMITPTDVARLRPGALARQKPWTIDELQATFPQPVSNPKDWTLTASVNSGSARLAVDGNLDSRWTSGTPLQAGMWIQVELPQAALIGGVQIDSAKSADDYTRAYKIQVSEDGENWGKSLASGKGNAGVTEVFFPPVKAKFLRLTQTGSLNKGGGNFWSIHELKVLQPVAALPTIAENPSTPSAKPGDLAKMQEALPASAPAKPLAHRSVLVYGNANGFVHSSIPLGEQTIAALGAKTGAWTATISNDPASFDELKNFDAVVLVSTTGRFLIPNSNLPKNATPEERKAADEKAEPYREAETSRMNRLLRFVQEKGKGLAGIHAATDAYKDYPLYGDLIGGYFNGHPWNEKVGIKIDDPTNPLTAMFPKTGFDVADEIYQFTPLLNGKKEDIQPYSRSHDHVLLSLDYTTPGRTVHKGKGPTDDYAVAWIRQSGSGRVFYCSLGHREEIYYNPAVLKFYLAGIQYALGDLPADAAVSSSSVSAK